MAHVSAVRIDSDVTSSILLNRQSPTRANVHSDRVHNLCTDSGAVVGISCEEEEAAATTHSSAMPSSRRAAQFG
jgi:hypothetical protein